MTTLRTVLDGGRYFEGPRWHDGRLWFVDCLARKLLSISPSGDVREHAETDDMPCGLGILPDGRVDRPDHVQETPACLVGRKIIALC